MPDTWRSLEIFLPSALSREEVSSELRDGIIRFATDGGEFVHRIRIDACLDHPGGWRKWKHRIPDRTPDCLRQIIRP
jgi:hypothetical protein